MALPPPGSNGSAFVRSERTAWRTIGDMTVVIDLAAHSMMGLNPAAGWIWACLATPVRAADLGRRIRGAGPDAARAVAAFVADLAAHGLVAPAEAPGTAPAIPAPPVPFELPAILWKQPLRAAAFTCAHIGGQSEACNATPTT